MKIVRFNPHLALNFEVPRYSEYAGRAYNTFLERGAAKNNLRDSVHVSYEQKSGNHHSITVIISIGPTREKTIVRKTTTKKHQQMLWTTNAIHAIRLTNCKYVSTKVLEYSSTKSLIIIIIIIRPELRSLSQPAAPEIWLCLCTTTNNNSRHFRANGS
jgi:hypothetical protein